jgi:hypothetical protein
MHFIDTILQTGHIQTYELTYLYYPLYHIFSAVGVELTGITLRTALFIMMGLCWQVAVILGYLLFKKLTDSPRLAAVACLLFASGSQLIFYGSYAIARSLAFVFFMAWIYLVSSKATRDLRFLFLSLVVMVAMIMTHHVNVLLVIPLLLLVYICQIIINRRRSDRPLEPLLVYLLSISGIAYLVWLAPDLSGDILVGAVRSALTTDTSIVGGDVSGGYGVSVITGAVYYSFVLFLCFLGMRVLFNQLKIADNRAAGAFALAGFVLLLVYVPGPLDLLPLSGILMTYRLNLMASPFIALLMACGVSSCSMTAGIPSPPGPSFYGPPPCFWLSLRPSSTYCTGNAQDNESCLTHLHCYPLFFGCGTESFSFRR